MRGWLGKLALVAIVGLVVGWTVGPAAAAPKWLLFGDAMFVKEGQGDNPWALQLRSDPTIPPTFGGVRFTPPGEPMVFTDLWSLGTDYDVTDDDCGGGSPRFQVRMDMDGDGMGDANVFVYIGPFPNFSGCAGGWQSTGNLIGATDARYDLTQVGGTFYDTYGNAVALVGGKTVTRVSLPVDAGWAFADGEQTILVDNVTVNDHVLSGHGAAGS